jgi:hypothetical protein
MPCRWGFAFGPEKPKFMKEHLKISRQAGVIPNDPPALSRVFQILSP